MKKITKIIIGTHNKGKFSELSSLLPKRLKKLSPDNFKIKSPIENGKTYKVSKRDGSIVPVKISRLYVNEGLKRVEKEIAYAGDIVAFAGVSHISIGETLCDPEHVEPMEMIEIEKPTLAMNFLVNDGPFVGRSGKLVTTRQIRARLKKELETKTLKWFELSEISE